MSKLTKYTKTEQCQACKFCTRLIRCPSPEMCVGCASCFLGCPYEAIEPYSVKEKRTLKVQINGKAYEIPYGITVKKALEEAGFRSTRYPAHPEEGKIFAPCETGGCESCAVVVNGQIVPSCHTTIQANMKIETKLPTSYVPRRIVDGFGPHMVGGVGTPWDLKTKHEYIEIACFASGCNFRCRTCQNYTVTYRSVGRGITPERAAIQLTALRRQYQVDRMAISGGESTLNRPWLVQFLKKLSFLNPDKQAHLHVDTNASILTPDYIDELVQAGMTDIGPDLKAVTLETFLKVTCLSDTQLAQKYMETAWDAVKYIADRYYPEPLFMGVGLPYNKFFYPDRRQEELSRWAEKLCQIDPSIQVCILDYRPEFRSYQSSLEYPTVEEMKEVKALLEGVGLKRVIAQTRQGHLSPKE